MPKIKFILLSGLFVLLLSFQALALTSSANTLETTGWPTFKGAWFEIQYPKDFKVSVSQPSQSNPSGYDSAFFTAPDGSVEFYIYSPQTNGDPEDIRMLDSEFLIGDKEERVEGQIIHRYAFKARNRSYVRNYIEVEDVDGNNTETFGIKYKSDETFNAYQNAFKYFQDSLVKYAD